MAGVGGALSGINAAKRKTRHQDINEEDEIEEHELLPLDGRRNQDMSPPAVSLENPPGQRESYNEGNSNPRPSSTSRLPMCNIVINEQLQKNLLPTPVAAGVSYSDNENSYNDDGSFLDPEGRSISGDSGSYVLQPQRRYSSKGNTNDAGGERDPGPVKKRFLPFFRKFWPHLQKEKDPPENAKEKVCFSPNMYGKPVEEVDPFVFDDTFCVISKKFDKNYVFRFSASKSLFLLGPLNPFRRLCLYLVTHQVFDLCIIIAILSNCVALAFDSNELEKNEKGEYIAQEENLPGGIEWAFLLIYTTELILKVGAKGFVLNKYSYLRNGWNILDCVVVVFGWATEVITFFYGSHSDFDLDIFRTFRVLRAVKTISILPGLRMMINALMNSIMQLVEVMALTFFCLCIFALFALEVYMGKLHQVCVLNKGSETAKMIYNKQQIEPTIEPVVILDRAYEWKMWVTDRRNWQQRDFPKDEFVPCGNDTGTRRCPPDYTCLPNLNDNPDDGWTSFDNFFKSMLSTFQLITLDYWERLYELVMSTVGPWCLPFFIMVVFLGSFYLLNLMLAVVTMSYEAEASSWDQKPLTKHQKMTLHRSNSTFSFEEPQRLHVTMLTQYSRRSAAEREALAKTMRHAGRRRPRRAMRRKMISKQNERRKAAANTNPEGLTVVTPDLRSTSGSICGSLFESEVTEVVKPPKNKILRSGVLGESSMSAAKPKPPPKKMAPGKMMSDIYQVVSRVSQGAHSAESPTTHIKPLPKIIPSAAGGHSGSAGIRVKIRTSPGDENKTKFFLEAETPVTTSTETVNDMMIEVLGDKPDVAKRLSEIEELGKRAQEKRQEKMKLRGEAEGHRALGKISDGDEMSEASKASSMREVSVLSSGVVVISSNERPPGHYTGNAVLNDCGNKYAKDSNAMGKIDMGSTVPGATAMINKKQKLPGPIELYIDRIRVKLVYFVSHWLFEVFITMCIVLNTLLLAAEHHGQPEWLEKLISTGSHCFTGVFTLECVIKIIALRREYFRQSWNLFDLFIVFSSFLDLILEQFGAANGIRVMRLLRIFKLAQSWVTMKILLNIIFSTFGALGNLTLVLAIVIYIFAVLGMQLVGTQYTPVNFGLDDPNDEDFPRWTFRNFWYSFMMIFRVLCGEWIEPLWDCLLAHRGVGEQWRCFLIFLPVLIIGNFIVLNLFLALLLNSFSTEELKAQRDKEMETSGKTDNLKKIVGMLLSKKGKGKETNGTAEPALALALDQTDTESEFAVKVTEQESKARVRFKKATQKVIMQHRKAKAITAIAQMEENIRLKEAAKAVVVSVAGSEIISDHAEHNAPHSRDSMVNNSRKREQKYGLRFAQHERHETSSTFGTFDEDKQIQENYDEDEKPKELPHCIPEICLPETFHCCWCWERTRKLALSIVTAGVFEWSILSLILASSVTLCFEDIYLEQNPDLKFILFILNSIFTVIFLIEMLLKWWALGIYQYFTTFWTILDAFIVVVSLISLYVDIENETWKPNYGENQRVQSLGALKALRTLRALRPLRAISRWQGMKVVVNALMFAIPAIFNVLLVCLLFWLIFAIMGVNLFKGKFYRCVYNENGSIVSPEIVRTQGECCQFTDSKIYNNATTWINSVPNFDNVFIGYLSLFQVATFEGWIEIMRAASDVTSVDEQPQRDSSYHNYIFFIIFIIFGAFFTLNLFIGVIIDNFNMLKKKYEGNLLEVLLTPSQRRYYTAMKKLGRKKPRRVIRRPKNKFFALFYDISMSRRFEIAIFVMIFLNMVVMAFEQHNQRQLYAHILAGFNAYFSTIYALEAIVKIIGLRHFYFTIAWNVFDFLLVIFSLIDLFLADASISFPFPPTLLRVVRVFRIGRVLRLIKAAKGIRKLLFALIVSLPALFNIGALLALITFIYSILGMALFKDAAKSGPVDDLFSFETFIKTSLMLFRLLTAAGWNEVLDSLLEAPKTCGEYRKIKCGMPGEPECVSQIQAVLYMVTYIIITYLIVINMYIAIILENFVEANRDEEVGIVEDDLESFYIRWSRYDPGASQFIGFEQLSEFLASLDPPLDIPKPNMVAIVSFNLPIARGNKIHCLDILHALVRHVLGQVEESGEFKKIQDQMERKFRKQFPNRKHIDVISSTRIWKLQQNSAIIIQRAWRTYKQGLNPPLDKAKSTQTLRPGFGQHLLGRMGNFFHSDDRKRRGSAVPNPNSFLLGGQRKGSDRTKEGSPNPSQARSSYSSQSSSSASPLARVEETPTETPIPTPSTSRGSRGSRHSRGRRLSPSRLSGGSFEVAINYGNMSNNQLLAVNLPSILSNKSPSPVFTSRNSSIPGLFNDMPLSPTPSTQTHTYPSMSGPLTPLASCPTSPSSSFDDSHSQSSVIIQVHPNN